jgi:hypothetical protein
MKIIEDRNKKTENMDVLKNIKLIKYIFSGILFLIISCKDKSSTVDCSTYDYSNCDTKEPFTGNFHIKLTINPENQAVPITIYQGKLEDGNVLIHDTLTNETYDTLLPVNNFYTVAAKYKVGSGTVTAVDGDKVTKSSSTTCDSTCWSVKTGTANVKLKK